jgi:Fic family protein
MARLQDLFKKIDTLHAQLEKLKPLKREDEARLWKKFRLEWNYNSNHIEGNTLTYGQTELLLIFEKTTGDHDMRDYEEMKAHDVALRMVTEYAKDPSREITEADIREINKIILLRPFWSNAQTPDGQPTRKLIQPGEYKMEPNSVLLQNGEMFHYASPEDTPIMMKELLEWYADAVKQKKLHLVEIAALIHYKFVRIHPFDDSNGRTSRLLMNYVLLRYGYPPVIIKSADKKNYLNALNKADVGDVNAFVEYVSEQLVSSLEMSIKAAMGESIEELSDVDKEIKIWKRQFNEDNRALPKSVYIISLLFRENLADFLQDLSDKFSEFRDLFAISRITFSYTILEKDSIRVYVDPSEVKNHILNIYLRNINDDLNINFPLTRGHFYSSNDLVELLFSYEGFKNKKKIYLDTAFRVSIGLNQYTYSIRLGGEILLSKEYSEGGLNPEEKLFLIKELTKKAFNLIRSDIEKLNKI